MNQPTPVLTPPSLRPANARSLPWVWSQRWLDLLFFHWRVPATSLRPHIPVTLEIDEYEGEAWVSLVLFRLRVRPRLLPFLPGVSSLLEMNLRTYVRCNSRPGICFLSADADNRWAIFLARCLTPMPYVRANLRYDHLPGQFQFKGELPSANGFQLSLTCRPISREQEARKGSHDAWLLERYRLFIQDRRERLLCAEVQHPRWRICDLATSVRRNTIGESFGLELSRAPDRAHYSPGVHAVFGAFDLVEN